MFTNSTIPFDQSSCHLLLWNISHAWKLKNSSKFPSVYMVMWEREREREREGERVNRHWESWIGRINFWHLYQLPPAFYVFPLHQHLLLTPTLSYPSMCLASPSTFTSDTCPELPLAHSVLPPQQHLLLTPNSIIPFDQKLLLPIILTLTVKQLTCLKAKG